MLIKFLQVAQQADFQSICNIRVKGKVTSAFSYGA